MLLHEEPQAMDVLPSIPHVLWVHVQGPDNPGTQPTHWDPVHPSLRAPKMWDQICQDLQN